jgi:hypothetical protein
MKEEKKKKQCCSGHHADASMPESIGQRMD